MREQHHRGGHERGAHDRKHRVLADLADEPAGDDRHRQHAAHHRQHLHAGFRRRISVKVRKRERNPMKEPGSRAASPHDHPSAAATGVTPAMVHYYFNTRDPLIDVIIDERFVPLRSSMGGWLEKYPDDPGAALTALTQRFVEVGQAHPWFAPLWVREVISEGGLLRQRMHERYGHEHQAFGLPGLPGSHGRNSPRRSRIRSIEVHPDIRTVRSCSRRRLVPQRSAPRRSTRAGPRGRHGPATDLPLYSRSPGGRRTGARGRGALVAARNAGRVRHGAARAWRRAPADARRRERNAGGMHRGERRDRRLLEPPLRRPGARRRCPPEGGAARARADGRELQCNAALRAVDGAQPGR
ncbi:hypothetical protein PSAC2689_180114 [Paraburkholderia sacchari]